MIPPDVRLPRLGSLKMSAPTPLENYPSNLTMTPKAQIKSHLASQPEPKRREMEELHRAVLHAFPRCKLWFFDGKDADGKTVSNPTIGYGSRTIHYADGSTKEFFRIGLSANKTGLSVYILGLEDKTYLARTYGRKLGKASVTGYCIRFKTLGDINLDVLKSAIGDGLET
jgi:hypothetical protein